MQKLKNNISIWLLSIWGYIMLFDYCKTAFLIFFSQRNPYTNIGELLDILFKIVNDIKILLPILIIFALIELGLKHYKNIGYNFDKPFVNNPVIFFLFKLGFYLMFFPMLFLITVLFLGISFIPVQYNFVGWFLPTFLTTGLIFVNIPIKSDFVKFLLVSIFVFYALIIACLNFVK